MDAEFRQKLKDLRFHYNHKIKNGLATHKDYRAERRRLLQAHRAGKYFTEGFKKWMALRRETKGARQVSKAMFEQDLKNKKTQKKLGDF
jgi:hypothetical protein